VHGPGMNGFVVGGDRESSVDCGTLCRIMCCHHWEVGHKLVPQQNVNGIIT